MVTTSEALPWHSPAMPPFALDAQMSADIKTDILGDPSAQTLERNLVALKKYHPELAERLAHLEDASTLHVVTGKRGHPVLKATDGDGEFYLSSLYDPEGEAQRLFTEETKDKEYNVVILLGFGLGYSLSAALQHAPEGIRYAVVEPDLSNFQLALSTIDLTDLLEHKKITWVIGQDLENSIASTMGQLDLMHLRGWIPLISPAFHRLHQNFIKKFVDRLFHEVTAQRLGKATTVIASEIFLKNSFINLKEAIGAPGAMHFHEAWKDKPAIIVSAGPSLEKHLDLLREHQDKILLIAVGAAWKSLRAADIEPHMVVSVDPFIHNYPHFEGLEAKREWLISDFACNTDVVRTFNGRKAFAHSTVEKEALFRKIYGEWGVLPSGGSVANSAFSFALTLGASPIILVGQDLAYTGGISHATGHTDKHLLKDAIESDPDAFKEVPGYGDGPVVLTNTQMLTYKLWFENVIKSLSENKVINATEGGARIHGAEEKPLTEVLESFGKEPIDVSALWPKSHPNTKESAKKAVAALKKISGKIAHIRDSSEAAYRVMLTLSKEDNEYETPKARKLKIQYNKYAKQIAKQDITSDWFLSAFVQQEMFLAQRRMNLLDEKPSEKYKTNLLLHSSLPNACQRAIDFIAEICREISID